MCRTSGHGHEQVGTPLRGRLLAATPLTALTPYLQADVKAAYNTIQGCRMLMPTFWDADTL